MDRRARPTGGVEDAAEAAGVASGSLNQRVYQDIKAMILVNRLRPGHKLGHWELANMLGVSRTPIREALERLYQEGYVRRIPRRGFFVAEIDTEEAKDLYQAREALELYALRLTLKRGLEPAELARLDRTQAAYVRTIEERRTIERGKADREFHLQLAGLGGNRYIVRSLASIFERVLLKRRADGYHLDRGPLAAGEHAKLLAALRAGDRRTAEKVLCGHIRKGWAAFEQHLIDIGVPH